MAKTFGILKELEAFNNESPSASFLKKSSFTFLLYLIKYFPWLVIILKQELMQPPFAGSYDRTSTSSSSLKFLIIFFSICYYLTINKLFVLLYFQPLTSW